MKFGERIFVQCECRDPAHLMEVELRGSIAEPELVVWYMLNPRLPFHKRLVAATRYVLGLDADRDAQWLSFDEFHLNAKAAEKIRDACDAFLVVWRRRVSETEAADRLRTLIKRLHGNSTLLGEWSEVLAKKLGRPAKEIEEKGLTAYDFPPERIRLLFEDDSVATFDYAFAVEHDEQVALFTEHNGYHVFPACCLVGVEVNPFRRCCCADVDGAGGEEDSNGGEDEVDDE